MKTLAVDSNNDLYVGGGRSLAIKTDLAALAQVCAQEIKTMRGEYFLDITRGMPNFELIWSGSPRLLQYEAAIRTTLSAVSGVTDVESVETFVENGVLSYTATIKTIYGVTTLGL